MRAWLTPDSSLFTNPLDTRFIAIPGDLWYLVNGALILLTERWNWEQFGTATPDEAVAFFTDILDEFTMNTIPVGQIAAFLAVPQRWIELDGSVLLQSDYPELTAVCPASWLSGSDINLPDMVGRSPVGEGVGTSRTFTLGDVGGVENVTLSLSQIPAHTHSVDAVTVLIRDVTPTPVFLSKIPGAGVTGSAGGGNSHENMSPHLVVKWCVYTARL